MMESLTALHFVRPGWLWLLLALPALWLLWRWRQRHQTGWRDVVDSHLLPHLLEQGGRATRVATWMGALGFVLAVLALAGPSWRQLEQPLWQSQAPLVIAVDLSSAMAANDLQPSRLLQARAKLATLLRERGGGQVALVAFAGEAFTVAPLTDDVANVALFLDSLAPDVMPVDGHAVDKAIGLSVQLMRQAGFEQGDILVFSDRAGRADQAAAAAAFAQGFRVSALGLGTAQGAPYRARTGSIEQARLDAGALQALATAGGGAYRALARDQADLRALGVLTPAVAEAASTRGAKGLSWQDEGYWLLPVLMLLALFAFRRGGALAAVVLCAMLPMAGSVQAAERGWWQRADQAQHRRIEAGADAYRKGDYAAAVQAFDGIDTATGHYNQGNALAKQGRLDEAIAAYDRALGMVPAMEDAIENRKVVDAARKRRQSAAGQNQGQSPDDPQKGQGSAPGSQSDAQAQSAAPQPSKPGQSDAQPAPEPPPRPEPATAAADAAEQQAADAAQRQRMAEAVAGDAQQQGEPAAGQAAGELAAESAEQRERRQAVDAWLRRVPDDPGGLLKAKFQLEYERRQREGR